MGWRNGGTCGGVKAGVSLEFAVDSEEDVRIIVTHMI